MQPNQQANTPQLSPPAYHEHTHTLALPPPTHHSPVDSYIVRRACHKPQGIATQGQQQRLRAADRATSHKKHKTRAAATRGAATRDAAEGGASGASAESNARSVAKRRASCPAVLMLSFVVGVQGARPVPPYYPPLIGVPLCTTGPCPCPPSPPPMP